jgi:hypothetical protein
MAADGTGVNERDTLFDLLGMVQGETSFAAFFVAFAEDLGYARSESGRALAALRGLAHEGFIDAWQMEDSGAFRPAVEADWDKAAAQYPGWLVTATRDDVALDEVGLWFTFTPRGWEQWERVVHPNDAAAWTMEIDRDARVIEVRAKTLEAVERALVAHGERDPYEEVPGTREVTAIDGFEWPKGRPIVGGLVVRLKYRDRGQTA